MDAIKDIVAGTVGGIAVCLVGHPLDTLKVRLQTQPSINPIYSGTYDCLKKTIQWEGAGGLYKGVASPLIGQMFFNSAQFLSYGIAKNLVAGAGNELTIGQYLLAGALTGFAVSFVESPIDLIKSQMQVQIFAEKSGVASDIKYTGVADCAKKIASTYGIRGIYQGIVPTIIRDIPAVSMYFGFYELSRLAFARRSPVANGDVSKLSSAELLVSGGIGGTLYWAFTYPIDVIKSSIQGDHPDPSKRKYSGFVDCAQKLNAEGGYKRFFRGAAPCLMRAFPANAACFFAYEKTRQYLN
eukprot:TRINITY_DN11235_c0_g1_i1.p1 TRINITY_DN11235_c0_g1~~TRINITY_DN11235_c0_g1_i1.p1  ORF type:complete len:297 (+),score=130.56 TRINITY_DN11235_c0_g1_i1:111-1001(+)